MLSEQVITFLEANIIFLLLTNAVSVAVAAYAVSVATGLNTRRRESEAVVMSRANVPLAAAWPSRRR